MIDAMTKWKELGFEEIVDMQPFQEQIGQIEYIKNDALKEITIKFLKQKQYSPYSLNIMQ